MKKFGLHPLFLIFGIILICCGWANVFFNFVSVAILHELAHAFAAKKLGYELSAFFLMPYGAGLSFKQNFYDEKDEILIASAGPICNFALAFFCISLWWIFPAIFPATELFVYANIITGTINLLPAYPLDGGRIFTSFLTLKNRPRKNALKICFVFNYIISAVFVVVFLLDIFNHFSFLIFAFFVFLGTFDLKLSGNYSLKNFPFFENKFQAGEKIQINSFGITSETEIFRFARYLKKNKINLAFVIFDNKEIKILNESTIINILQNYPSTSKICDIINENNKKIN